MPLNDILSLTDLTDNNIEVIGSFIIDKNNTVPDRLDALSHFYNIMAISMPPLTEEDLNSYTEIVSSLRK